MPGTATAPGPASGVVGGSFTWPITATSSATPNIVWQGTTSGSTYTSANVALGGGGAGGKATWHP